MCANHSPTCHPAPLLALPVCQACSSTSAWGSRSWREAACRTSSCGPTGSQTVGGLGVRAGRPRHAWEQHAAPKAQQLVTCLTPPAQLLAAGCTLCALSTPTGAGPYTSYDINTLLRNTSGSRQDITLSPKDDLMGETSRIAGAHCAWQPGDDAACTLRSLARLQHGALSGRLQGSVRCTARQATEPPVPPNQASLLCAPPAARHPASACSGRGHCAAAAARLCGGAALQHWQQAGRRAGAGRCQMARSVCRLRAAAAACRRGVSAARCRPRLLISLQRFDRSITGEVLNECHTCRVLNQLFNRTNSDAHTHTDPNSLDLLGQSCRPFMHGLLMFSCHPITELPLILASWHGEGCLGRAEWCINPHHRAWKTCCRVCSANTHHRA